jgi:Uma2 family endonuclease
MAMPAVRSDWTVEMLDELLDELPDDGNRYELIDGELFVTPAPSDVDQLVVGALQKRLWDYLRATSLARVIASPSDVRRDDRRKNRIQPDVYVVKLVDGKRPPYPFDLADVLLAVEVLSPNNSKYDYQTKRRLYLRGGVPEYWIVDPDAHTVARWRGATDPGERLAERIAWQPAGLDVPLVVERRELFEDALG